MRFNVVMALGLRRPSRPAPHQGWARAAGKPYRVALAAVLRKLVVLANALVRDNRLWSPCHA